MASFSGIKLSVATWMFVIAGLLLSFCCPEQTRSGDRAGAGSPSTSSAEGNGSETPRAVTISNQLPVIPRVQEGYHSCWAACAEMIMEFVGGERIRQCVQAGVAFGFPACCVGDGVLEPASPCDKQGHPQFNEWGFDFEFQSEPLSWEELTREINERRPFAFSWVENFPQDPPVNHMMVLVGYHEADGDKKVFYIDPLFDPVHVPIMTSFSDYQGSGVHPHKSDYCGIRPR